MENVFNHSNLAPQGLLLKYGLFWNEASFIWSLINSMYIKSPISFRNVFIWINCQLRYFISKFLVIVFQSHGCSPPLDGSASHERHYNWSQMLFTSSDNSVDFLLKQYAIIFIWLKTAFPPFIYLGYILSFNELPDHDGTKYSQFL